MYIFMKNYIQMHIFILVSPLYRTHIRFVCWLISTLFIVHKHVQLLSLIYRHETFQTIQAIGPQLAQVFSSSTPSSQSGPNLIVLHWKLSGATERLVSRCLKDNGFKNLWWFLVTVTIARVDNSWSLVANPFDLQPWLRIVSGIDQHSGSSQFSRGHPQIYPQHVPSA